MNWKLVWCTVIGLCGMLVQSFLIWLAWKWFILSQFPVPELTWLQALGITVFVPVVRRLIDIPTKQFDMTDDERLSKAVKMLMALCDSFIILCTFKLGLFLMGLSN